MFPQPSVYLTRMPLDRMFCSQAAFSEASWRRSFCRTCGGFEDVRSYSLDSVHRGKLTKRFICSCSCLVFSCCESELTAMAESTGISRERIYTVTPQ
jgi:hypothetical protein